MSCNAGVGDKAKLAQGHYSSRVLAPTGGGKTTISLGGGYGNQPKRTQNQRGLGGVKSGGGGRNNMTSQMGNMSVGRGNGTKGVRRVPQQQGGGRGQQQAPSRGRGQQQAPSRGRGAAGGSAALNNAGGYGNLDIHSKPSSRVLAPTGGGKTTISLGGGYGNNQKPKGQQQRGAPKGQQQRGAPAKTQQRGAQKNAPKGQQQRGAAGGSSALKNGGGYGNLDIHSKASSRVLSQPGGGSSGIFGGATDSRKTNLNASQQRAKSSLQSNVFGGPTTSSKKTQNNRQPGGGTSQQPRGNSSTRGIKPVGGGSNMQLGGAGRGAVKRSTNNRQPGGGTSQQNQPRRGVAKPKQNRGAAGGSGAIKNSGGYGNLDIHSKPSSRVLNQPGGGSSSQGLF